MGPLDGTFRNTLGISIMMVISKELD
jgi:hypothetical protein